MAGVQSRMDVATSERDLLLKQQKDAKGEGLGPLAGCLLLSTVVLFILVCIHSQLRILMVNTALLASSNAQRPDVCVSSMRLLFTGC